MELQLSWIDGIFAVIVVLLIIGIHKFANWYCNKYDK